MVPQDLFRTKSLKNIYYASSMIDSIQWQNDRSLAVRVTNLLRVLVGTMYGKEIEDTDSDPAERMTTTETNHDEKTSIELAIKARQSESSQLESYSDLAKTLAEKNRQLTERMKEVNNG